MKLPHVGEVTKDEELDWLCSEPIPVPVLGGQSFSFVLEAYEDDPCKEDFHNAISAFLSLKGDAMKSAEPYVQQYFLDSVALAEEYGFPLDESCGRVAQAGDVWGLVEFRGELMVSRRPYEERDVYISIGGSCTWEKEHGIDIVFRAGIAVSKVGPYDGHLTNADAFGDRSLEGVIYRPMR